MSEPTVEALQSEITSLKASIATLESAQERTNRESKSHRLNAEAFQKQADELREKLTDVTAERDAANAKVIEEVDKVRLDLSARLKAAETARDEAATSAKTKVTDVELRAIARDMGVSDLDYLKLLDRSALKIDDDGNPLNATEVFETWKSEKPHFFGAARPPGTATGTTANPAPAPRAAPPNRVDAMAIPAGQYEMAKSAAIADARR